MAEAFLNSYGNERFIAESAGLEPGKMNPNVVKVMHELGINLSKKSTQAVVDLYQKGNKYDAVITVCDEASAEKCPVFPGSTKTIGWSFEDPSSVRGAPEEVLQHTRRIRDRIQETVKKFIEEASLDDYWI
jgi:arsenate reductase